MGQRGISTLLITWITPFEAPISVLMMRAPPTVTVPWLTLTFSDRPLSVLTECSFTTFAAVSLPLGHVVEQDGLQLRLVLGECSERRLRHLRERGVRRCEHGQRPLPGEGAREARLLDERDERLERTGGDGRLDDVLGRLVRTRCRRGDHPMSSRKEGDDQRCDERLLHSRNSFV